MAVRARSSAVSVALHGRVRLRLGAALEGELEQHERRVIDSGQAGRRTRVPLSCRARYPRIERWPIRHCSPHFPLEEDVEARPRRRDGARRAPLRRTSSACTSCRDSTWRATTSSARRPAPVRGPSSEPSASASVERFAEGTRAVDFVADWRVVDGGDQPIERVLVELGNTVDLIIAAQTRDPGQRGSRSELTARLLAGCGRPVLLVPPERAPDNRRHARVRRLGRATGGHPCAVRRVADARASRRGTPAADQHPRARPSPRARGHRAARRRALAPRRRRRALPCDAREGRDRARAARLRHRLGCGHDRLGLPGAGAVREFLLGSTTRYLLEHTTLPVLMSH